MDQFLAFAKAYLPNQGNARFQATKIVGQLALQELSGKILAAIKKEDSTIMALCISPDWQIHAFEGDCIIIGNRAMFQFENEERAAVFADTVRFMQEYQRSGLSLNDQYSSEGGASLLSRNQRPVPLARQGIFDIIKQKPDLISVRAAMGAVFRSQNSDLSQLYLALNEVFSLIRGEKLGDGNVIRACGKIFEILQEPQTMIQIRALKIISFIANHHKQLFREAVIEFDGLKFIFRALQTSYRIEKQTGKVFINSELLLSLITVIHELLAGRLVNHELEIEDQNLRNCEERDEDDVTVILNQSSLQSNDIYEQLQDVLNILFSSSDNYVSMLKCNVAITELPTLQAKSNHMTCCGLILAILSDFVASKRVQQIAKKTEGMRTMICAAVEEMELEVCAFLAASSAHEELEYTVESGYFCSLCKMLRFVDICIRSYSTVSAPAVESFVSSVFNGTSAIQQALKICRLILCSDAFYGKNFYTGFALSGPDELYYNTHFSQLAVTSASFLEGLSIFLQRSIKDFVVHEDLYESIQLLIVRGATLLGLNRYSEAISGKTAHTIFNMMIASLVDSEFFEQTALSLEFCRAIAEFLTAFPHFDKVDSDISTLLPEMLASIIAVLNGGYDNDRSVDILKAAKVTEAISELVLLKPELLGLTGLLVKAATKLEGQIEQLLIAPYVLLSHGVHDKQLQGVVEFVSKASVPYDTEIGAAIREYLEHLCDIILSGERNELLPHLFEILKAISVPFSTEVIPTENLMQLLALALNLAGEDIIELFCRLIEYQLEMESTTSRWLQFIYNDAKNANCRCFNQLIRAASQSISNRSNPLLLIAIAAFCFNLFNKSVVDFYRKSQVDVLSPSFSIIEFLGTDNSGIASSPLLRLLDAGSVFLFLERNFDLEQLPLMHRVIAGSAHQIVDKVISKTFCQEIHKLLLESVDHEAPAAPLILEVYFAVSDIAGGPTSTTDYHRLLRGLVASEFPDESAISTVINRASKAQRPALFIVDAVFECLLKFDSQSCIPALSFIREESDYFSRDELLLSILKHDMFLSNLLMSKSPASDRIELFSTLLSEVSGAVERSGDVAMSRLQFKSIMLSIANTGAMEQAVKDLTDDLQCAEWETFLQLYKVLTLMLNVREFHVVLELLNQRFELISFALLLLVYASPCRTPAMISGTLERLPPQIETCFRQLQRFDISLEGESVSETLTLFLIGALEVRRIESFFSELCNFTFMHFAADFEAKAFESTDEDAETNASNLILAAVEVGEECKLNYINSCLDNASECLIVKISSLMEKSQLADRVNESQIQFVRHTIEILRIVSETTEHKVAMCESQNFVSAIAKCIISCQAIHHLQEAELQVAEILENVSCSDTFDMLICQQESTGSPLIRSMIAFFERVREGEAFRVLLHVLGKMLECFEREVARCVKQHGEELYYCLSSINSAETQKILEMLE